MGYGYGFFVGILAWGSLPYIPRGRFRTLSLLAGLLAVATLIWALRLKERWRALGLALFLAGLTNFAVAVLLAVNSSQIVLNFWLTLGIFLASMAWLFSLPFLLD